MIISKKRQYQDSASIREPGRCRSEFCDEPVDQTSRDPNLVARRNHKFGSRFRLIGQGTNHRFTRSRECPILVGGRLPVGNDGHKLEAELGPQKQYRSLRFKCNGLLYLNRGLPGSTVYDLSTVPQPEVRGEISPRIKCSSEWR